MGAKEQRLTWVPGLRWSRESSPVLEPALGSALLDNISARVCVVDRQQVCIYANREWLDFLGKPVQDVVGQHMSKVLGEAVYSRYRPLAERILAGEGLHVEGWVDYPSNGRRYLKEIFVPYGPDGGEVSTVAIYGRDETELRLREEELAARLHDLEASEALKSAIFDHALAALISTDADSNIVEFNPAAEAMFRLTREAALGRSVSDVMIPPRYREAHQAGMQRMHDGNPARVLGKRLEMHALRADGSEFPIEMVLWRTSVAGTAFYTASISDVTERQASALEIDRQREALRQSEKLGAMGSLLAGVAHELNNPLAIVMGRAGMLEESCETQALPDVARLRADARSIREAAERCGRIVRTFLDMARSRPSQRRSVDLNDLVLAAKDMLNYGLRTHGIELDVALAEGLPELLADGDQIGQIVMNLLVNAQQVLTDVRGARQVRVQTGFDAATDGSGTTVWLRVADNGPGVSNEVRARIFEPFFTTKPEGEGTGLGLALSRSLARDHGGDLALEATSVLGGASFLLRLPVGGEVVNQPSEVAGASPLPVSITRILVVDDEPELAALMRDILERAGYDVATAESGAVALELMEAARFDAIVSDLRMPDMDGATLWRAVSSRFPVLAERMLFVTGDTLSPDAHSFLKRSGRAALDKPFANADLLAKVAALLA